MNVNFFSNEQGFNFALCFPFVIIAWCCFITGKWTFSFALFVVITLSGNDYIIGLNKNPRVITSVEGKAKKKKKQLAGRRTVQWT